MQEAEIRKGDWLDPEAGAVLFEEYATSWVAELPNLRPKTVQLYEWLVRQHLVPVLGKLAVADIQLSTVRRWRKSRLDAGVSAITVAKAYRLLKAIMNTALDDGLVKRNPCRIDGAGQEHSPERPVLTIRQVLTLADAFTDRRYRLLVLLAVFCCLRWGELAALRRRHIDLETGRLRVEMGVVELANGKLLTGLPKSAAGVRWVTIPTFLMWSSTWTCSPILILAASSLSARWAASCAAATSIVSGARPYR